VVVNTPQQHAYPNRHLDTTRSATTWLQRVETPRIWHEQEQQGSRRGRKGSRVSRCDTSRGLGMFFLSFLSNYTNLCLETIYSAYGRHCHLCTHAHTDSQTTHTGDRHQDDKQLPKRWRESSRPARLEPLEVCLIFSSSFYYYANDYIGNYMCTNEERGTESRQGWQNGWLWKGPDDASGVVWAISEFFFSCFINTYWWLLYRLRLLWLWIEMKKGPAMHLASFGPLVSFFFFHLCFINTY
jgi:hypothetical protein